MSFQADGVQGLLFPSPTSKQADARHLWAQILPEQEPDAFQKIANSPALQSNASGIYNGLNITIAAQVGRIVITANAPQPDFADQSEFPKNGRISDVDNAIDIIANFISNIGSGLEVARCAIVVNAAYDVNDADLGGELNKLIPHVNLPEHATDVIHQINVRRCFAHNADLQMNRLCNWHTGQTQFLQITNGGMPMAFVVPPMTIVSTFVGLKLDINTAPELPVPNGEITSVVSDLAEEAKAILRQGYSRLLP